MSERPQRPPEPPVLSIHQPLVSWLVYAGALECVLTAETKRADEAEAKASAADDCLGDQITTLEMQLANVKEEAARRIEKWHRSRIDGDNYCEIGYCTCLANAALVRHG